MQDVRRGSMLTCPSKGILAFMHPQTDDQGNGVAMTRKHEQRIRCSIPATNAERQRTAAEAAARLHVAKPLATHNAGGSRLHETKFLGLVRQLARV